MGNLTGQILDLLTTSPGNLAYHLVLVISIIGALAAALNYQYLTRSAQGRRMGIGFGALLGLRAVLFVLAGITWQGLLNEHLVLPPVDRAVMLVSLVLIIWMWAFPQPSRLADAATLLLEFLVLLVSTTAMLWWLQEGSQLSFNGSWVELVFQATAAILLLVGIILVIVRKPLGWGFGLGMLGLLLAGQVLLLASRPNNGDYSAIVRLAQMAAYPLMIAIPQRLPQPKASKSRMGLREAGLGKADPRLVKSLLTLNTETDSGQVCQAIVLAVSSAVPAEICLLLSPLESGADPLVSCGYDQVREAYLEGFALPASSIPEVLSAFREKTIKILPGEGSSTDQLALAKSLAVSQVGHLLFAPVLSKEGSLLAGLILLSPYSRRGWTEAEQATLEALLNPVAQLLQHANKQTAVQAEAEKMRRALDSARSENETLLSQLSTAKTPGDHSQAASLAALLAVQEEAQQLIESLQSENERLQLKNQGQAAVGEIAAFHTLTQNQVPSSTESEYLEGELRLALEEIARLKGALSESDIQLLGLKQQMDGTHLLRDQNQAIILTIQELRQSMSSIIGYTDFLLGESVGILGSLQRKFLERVKISTERMNRLVEDMVQITSIKEGRHLITFERVDLNEIIVEAISNTTEQLHEKNITLKLDLPGDLPQIQTDRIALQQVLTNLLDNAGDVTPANNEVLLRTVLQTDDTDRQYLLIQVTDHGGGIPVADIPRVFARLPRGDGHAIPGIGPESNNLYVVKMLIETLEGRIWVDSEAGSGSTFSILLPLAHPTLPADGAGGLEA